MKSYWFVVKRVKAEHFYSASSWELRRRSRVWITQLLPCKHSKILTYFKYDDITCCWILKLTLTLVLTLTLTDTGGAVLTLMLGYRSLYITWQQCIAPIKWSCTYIYIFIFIFILSARFHPWNNTVLWIPSLQGNINQFALFEVVQKSKCQWFNFRIPSHRNSREIL